MSVEKEKEEERENEEMLFHNPEKCMFAHEPLILILALLGGRKKFKKRGKKIGWI